MKRKYVKPYLLVEPYQLDAECAACSTEGAIPIYHSDTICGIEWPGNDKYYYFGTEATCETDLVNNSDEEGDGFCYHGPFVAGIMFTYS